MRRSIALALVLGMLGALSAAPALAKKKKKPPVTFEASGTVAIGHPAMYSAGMNIVGTEFTETCAIPASQGIDGFVVELSDEISKVTSTIQLTGTDVGGIYDLDMYFYNKDCGPVGEASTETLDESGVFAAGTKYVLVTSYTGVGVEFDLAAKELR